MTSTHRPTFSELTADECQALLARGHVGRIAFTLHDRVDIEPIHYIHDGDWLFGRTSKGSKLSKLLHNPWCAFETDEIEGLFDWASVVVKGTFCILDPEMGSTDTYQRAEKALKRLVPGTFTTHDPAPHRDIVFGIYVREVTGRASKR